MFRRSMCASVRSARSRLHFSKCVPSRRALVKFACVRSQERKTESVRSLWEKFVCLSEHTSCRLRSPGLRRWKIQFLMSEPSKEHSWKSASEKSRLLSLHAWNVQLVKLVMSNTTSLRSQFSKRQLVKELSLRLVNGNRQLKKLSFEKFSPCSSVWSSVWFLYIKKCLLSYWVKRLSSGGEKNFCSWR